MSRLLLLPAPLFLLVNLAAAAPDFDRDVRPIFAEHCLECHSLDKAKGGLTLVAREPAMKKLKSGHTALVPGKPDASEIVNRMSSTDPEEQMPPQEHREKHPLAGNEI
ncbi:MAG TPA: c-type cytochrome domain-containing protein, partial [Verrucomicrobiaceae bacterium]